MVYVVAKSKIKEGKIEEYTVLAKKLVKATNESDEGCVQYELFQDVSNPQIFTIMEQWESQEALNTHFGAKHMKELLPLMKELREGDGEVNIYQKIS